MASQQEGGNELIEEIREVKKWARIQGLESLSHVLKEFNEEELVIFDLANGERSLSDIAEKVDSGSSTISRRMRDWNDLGIVEKDGRKWKHIAPLSAMGIERPNLDLEDKENGS
jgi:predicted transcriptional regulator